MNSQALEATKGLNFVEILTGFIAFFTLIVAVVINSSILLSGRYTASKRLFDSAVLLIAVDLVSAMLYGGIILSNATSRTGRAIVERYMQWFITVPLLIVAIIYYTDYLNTDNGSSQINVWQVVIVVVLGIAMLVFSCLGECIGCHKISFFLLSFVAYILTMAFYAIFFVTSNSAIFFWVVVVAFGLYGAAHMLESKYKEISFNILDTVTKVGFSLIIAFTLLGQA